MAESIRRKYGVGKAAKKSQQLANGNSRAVEFTGLVERYASDGWADGTPDTLCGRPDAWTFAHVTFENH